MPIVRIDIQSGKTTAYKRSILNGVRQAMTDALGVHDDRVMQRIIESPAENIDTTEIKSDRLTIVEISMLPGRGAELKNRLYDAIAKRLSFEPGISAHDLIVLVNDPAGECFYLNGTIQCDLPQAAERREEAPDVDAEDVKVPDAGGEVALEESLGGVEGEA